MRQFKKDLNYLKIPVKYFEFNEGGVEEFNEILAWWKEQYDEWHTIVRTPSGGICKKRGVFKLPCWDVQEKQNKYIELTIVTAEETCRYKISSTAVAVKESGMTGRKAFIEFESVCKQFGIDLRSMAIENGEEVKKEIPSPYIQLCRGRKDEGKTFMNAHHIDLNSSFMSGIMKANPVLAPAIQYVYANRKNDDKKYKAVLNMTYGFCQSEYCRIKGHAFALSQLSKDALVYNNNYIDDLLVRLIESGRYPILINTDGIWYTGEIYHDENEGTDLGQWKNDHVNCKFRAKSDGAYEYEENGKYHAVVRGSTRLDRFVQRDDWNWGDIYNTAAATQVKYYYDRKEMVVKQREGIV